MTHVERAQGDVEQGKKHLKSAEEKQKSARKKKICLFSTLAVVILIVILVIAAEFGLFSGGGDTETVRIVEKVVYVTVTPNPEAGPGNSTTTPVVISDIDVTSEATVAMNTTAAP